MSTGSSKIWVDGVADVNLRGTVDVHAHFLSHGYRAALAAAGIDRLDAMPGGIPSWSPGSALELMDDVGIATSILSISSPGVLLEPDDRSAVTLARQVNDDAADIVRASPLRFGFVASLPLPDVDAALAELDRATMDLSARGALLLTNYRGRYLGDEAFEPLFEELNRRGALVVIHPTAPCGNMADAMGYPPPLLEFIFETTRAVVNLILTGTLARYPDIRVVVPHGGAALPLLVDRVGRVSATLARADGRAPVDVRTTLRALYYDVAGGTPEVLLPALLRLAEPRKLLFGSDYPFTPAARVRELSESFHSTDLLTDDQRRDVFGDNAARLFADVVDHS